MGDMRAVEGRYDAAEEMLDAQLVAAARLMKRLSRVTNSYLPLSTIRRRDKHFDRRRFALWPMFRPVLQRIMSLGHVLWVREPQVHQMTQLRCGQVHDVGGTPPVIVGLLAGQEVPEAVGGIFDVEPQAAGHCSAEIIASR
jgi:hypothetical protein